MGSGSAVRASATSPNGCDISGGDAVPGSVLKALGLGLIVMERIAMLQVFLLDDRSAV